MRSASLFFLLLSACSAESAAPSSNGAPPATSAPTAGDPGTGDGTTKPPADTTPAAATDDPRSVFGSWDAVDVDLFSSDSIVGLAPIDATHVWIAVLAYGSLSVRMWNGSTWGDSIPLAGVSSNRLSGYGLRLVGKSEVWAYGPGILRHLENSHWVDLSGKLARDATWGADGVLAIAGWGDDVYLTAQTSAYRWSSAKGTLVTEASPPYADVVFGTSADDAWAFKEKPYGPGEPAIWRKKGAGKWTLLDFGDAGDLTYPNGAYGGAASLTPGNVWALGNNEVMRVSNAGDGFEKVTRPSTDESEVYEVVWTSSPNNTWVLGSVAYHWDGKTWTKADSALDGTFYGISGSSPDVVWAYGATSGSWSLYRLTPK